MERNRAEIFLQINAERGTRIADSTVTLATLFRGAVQERGAGLGLLFFVNKKQLVVALGVLIDKKHLVVPLGVSYCGTTLCFLLIGNT